MVKVTQQGKYDLTLWRILKDAQQGQHRTGAESDIYDCFVERCRKLIRLLADTRAGKNLDFYQEKNI